MAKLNFDSSDFKRKVNQLERLVVGKRLEAVQKVADEILRLSSLEVPLDKGFLMKSGTSQQTGDDEYTVGYNMPYAHRLHEHPNYNFKNGRKGKYLEDPMKKNMHVFRKYYDEKLGEIYNAR